MESHSYDFKPRERQAVATTRVESAREDSTRDDTNAGASISRDVSTTDAAASLCGTKECLQASLIGGAACTAVYSCYRFCDAVHRACAAAAPYMCGLLTATCIWGTCSHRQRRRAHACGHHQTQYVDQAPVVESLTDCPYGPKIVRTPHIHYQERPVQREQIIQTPPRTQVYQPPPQIMTVPGRQQRVITTTMEKTPVLHYAKPAWRATKSVCPPNAKLESRLPQEHLPRITYVPQ